MGDCQCGGRVSSPSASQASAAMDLDGIIRKRAEAEPLKVLAADLAIDPSLLGKFLNGSGALKLDDVSRLVKRLHLKPVDLSRTCVRTDEIHALRDLYARVQAHVPWLLDEEEA
jgi:hypothetical protein